MRSPGDVPGFERCLPEDDGHGVEKHGRLESNQKPPDP